VQTVDEVWAIPVIAEIPDKSKSVPFVVDSVEQFMFSFPVTVNVIASLELVAAERARVTVGVVPSTVTCRVDAAAVFP
jgi:hypothetical protein